jgi:hypothetical protein
LEKTGSLLVKILGSESDIDQGRKWLDTDGFEREGRIDYRRGLAAAMEAFTEVGASASNDLKTLIFAEYTFLTQELSFCDPADSFARASLNSAIQSFDDALRALEAVEAGPVYRIADMTHPRKAQYRVKEMPLDAFHVACRSHYTRLGNILRAPGINLTEKELLEQRRANLKTAGQVYIEKQKTALSQTEDSQS